MKIKRMPSKIWFFIVVFICLVVGSFMGISIMNAKSERQKEVVLRHFKSVAQDLEKNVQQKPIEEENKRKEIVNNLYDYIQGKLSEVSMYEILMISKDVFRTMPNREESSWKERLVFQSEVDEGPIVVDSLFWQSDEKELLVYQLNYRSYLLSKRGYMQGTPPHIYYKTGEKQIESDLSEWRYTGLGSTNYDIIGFVHGEHRSCPDIIISTGPVGSGNFVYFVQMHFDQSTEKWNQTWETGFGHVLNVEYSGDDGSLTITYLLDKFSRNTEVVNYSLKWGRNN